MRLNPTGDGVADEMVTGTDDDVEDDSTVLDVVGVGAGVGCWACDEVVVVVVVLMPVLVFGWDCIELRGGAETGGAAGRAEPA